MRPGRPGIWLAPLSLFAFAACNETIPTTVSGLSSYEITMKKPTADELGSPSSPVAPTSLTIDVQAIDSQGQPWTQNVDANVFISFAGNKIGQLEACGKNEDEVPLMRIHLEGGVATDQTVAIPKAYGVANLWVETANSDDGGTGNYAAGTSPPIYFANPTIPDVQTPYDPDPKVLPATDFYCTPFNGKHVFFNRASEFDGPDPAFRVQKGCTVGAPQATTDAECNTRGLYCGLDPATGQAGNCEKPCKTEKDCPAGDTCGPDPDQVDATRSYCLKHQSGQLVVSSVFINAFVVADTGALFHGATGTGGFNHLYVFAFGRPPDAIVPGRIISDMSGNISKFVGFTELNFPIQNYTEVQDSNLVPPVYVISPSERPGGDQFNRRLLRLAGATVSVTGTMCPIDQTSDDWKKFNQFNLDMGNPTNCDPFNTFSISLPSKVFGTFDPLRIDGSVPGSDHSKAKKLTVVGMLRNFSGQSEATSPPTTCGHDQSICTPLGTTVTCVEGTCKKAPYNFWPIDPRNQSDITIH